jgi:hypothetical protein
MFGRPVSSFKPMRLGELKMNTIALSNTLPHLNAFKAFLSRYFETHTIDSHYCYINGKVNQEAMDILWRIFVGAL